MTYCLTFWLLIACFRLLTSKWLTWSVPKFFSLVHALSIWSIYKVKLNAFKVGLQVWLWFFEKFYSQHNHQQIHSHRWFSWNYTFYYLRHVHHQISQFRIHHWSIHVIQVTVHNSVLHYLIHHQHQMHNHWWKDVDAGKVWFITYMLYVFFNHDLSVTLLTLLIMADTIMTESQLSSILFLAVRICKANWTLLLIRLVIPLEVVLQVSWDSPNIIMPVCSSIYWLAIGWHAQPTMSFYMLLVSKSDNWRQTSTNVFLITFSVNF